MKINDKKFFELAKENGISECDFCFTRSKSRTVSLYHSEVESYNESDSYRIIARGIYNGKFGQAVTEKINKDTPMFLINAIKSTASLIENDDPCLMFSKKEKYSKKNVFNKETANQPISKKIEELKEIESKINNYDKRVKDDTNVSYSDSIEETIMSNSYGLKLKSKKASCSYCAELSVSDGDDLKTAYNFFISLNPDELNIDSFVKETVEKALAKLGAKQCKSKKYPVVLDQECFSKLLKPYLSNVNAEDVQKQSSLFLNKLHQPIASKKLTVIENPLEKNIFFESFDDEGVPCRKKFIINKGILETYIYTLETASKEGVEPTGNSVRGNKMSAELNQLFVKNGHKTFDQMISKIKEGVYITDLQGLHSGMNAKSGNFSLQAQGFMIINGKIDRPLTLITLAGNLSDMFMNIKDVANDSKLILNGVTTPSVYIKKLAVSGE